MKETGTKRVIIILVCLISSVTGVAQTTDSLVNQLSRKWVNAKAYTLKLAELMPEDNYDFKPAADVMSFREQLLHMAGNMRWLSSSFLFSDSKIGIADTTKVQKGEVMKELSDAYDSALSAHYNLSAKQLDEIVPFFAGPMARRQILVLLHDHQTYHAGGLLLYLRLKGIKPPDYVGW